MEEEKIHRNKRARKTVLDGESREFVVRLYNYFEQENQNNGPLRPLEQVRCRVADALGIGVTTVNQIVKEKYSENNTEKYSENSFHEEKKLEKRGKNGKKSSYMTDIDEYTAAAIKTHIDQYEARGEKPTLQKLVDSLNEEDLFDGSRSSLDKILKHIGYKFVPNGVGHPVLTYTGTK